MPQVNCLIEPRRPRRGADALSARPGGTDCGGGSGDEIADAMVVSPATGKTHVSRAMIKLGARDRAQLVGFAYQTGLVTPRTAG